MPDGCARSSLIAGKLGGAALLAASLTLSAGSASAESFQRVTTIDVPGNPLTAFDISYVDPLLFLYALADRSNAAVDLFDTTSNTFFNRVGGFQGAVKDPTTGKVNNDISGPNGIVVVGHREIWAGDGDSTLKVVDLATLKVTDSISTGGKKRADELGFDGTDHIIAVANDADDPPFISLVSTDTHKVLATIPFDGTNGAPNATNGIEQTQWSPSTGLFYTSVPQIGSNAADGGVAVTDPKSMTVIKTFSVSNCQPAGLALGPNNRALLGCAGPGNATPPGTFPSQTVVIDITNGHEVARISQVGGSDQVWFNPGDGHYYLAARNNPGGGVLGVVDSSHNRFDQNVPTSTTAHSVAADPVTNHVFVPLGVAADNTVCTSGCIAVFGSSGSDNDDLADNDDH